MSKRNAVRVISFSLSVALACLVLFYKAEKKNRAYILQIENSYSYMLDELNTAANNIAETLNKARFATTKPCLTNMAAKLLTEAEISKSALSQLPVSSNLSALNRFFSQVGNYAMSLSESLTEDGISSKDTANIEFLSDMSSKVSEILNTSRNSYNNLEYWATEIDKRVTDTTEQYSLNTSLSQLENEFKDYPTLIYDGPYSDHILEKEPTLLKDTAETSRQQAQAVAAEWCKLAIEDLEFGGTTDGKIPTFDFLGEGISASVTKQGGYLLYFRRERPVEDIILTGEQALLSANAYLADMGLSSFRETYYFEADGICTVNFAYLDGKTLCYTDLIKVGVAMDTGEIMLLECGGYISNHKSRAFEVPVISEEEAKSIISPKLTVNSVRFALIPTNSQKEKRCYEFNCTSADSQEVLVYINTATLLEEEILILQKSDGGILVK